MNAMASGRVAAVRRPEPAARVESVGPVGPVESVEPAASIGSPPGPGAGYVPVPAPPQLIVGHADDVAERDADATAHRVVARLFRRDQAQPSALADLQAAQPVRVQRRRAAAGSPPRSAAAGRSGGTAEPEVRSRIDQLRSAGGGSLPTTVRGPMERAFGASFGGVRVHQGAQAGAVARDLGAQAFTLGRDIFLGRAGLDVSAEPDARLLAHELAHTLQAGDGAVHRDVGMEFESRQLGTGISTTGKPPAVGFATGLAADAMWNARDRVAKGKALLTRPDMEVQADDDGNTGNSDLEVVIDHLPETPNGRVRLDNAMNGLQTLIAQHGAVAQNHTSPAQALDGHGGFTSKMRRGLIKGNWANAPTAPQVTMGLRLQNVPDIVKDLHAAPGETALEKADRDPGRLAMRRADPHNVAEPRNLTVLDEAQTLVNGLTLAGQAVANYLINVDPAAVTDASLTGFLTIIFSYTESMARKQAFLKNHTPLMAKTDLAKMWTTLSGPTRTYWEQVDVAGVSNLEKVVGEAPGYTPKLPQALFHGVSGLVEDNAGFGVPQWYHTLTLQDWLRSIAVRPQPSKVQELRDFVFGDKDRRKDKLTTTSFPGRPSGQQVEGYGALGGRTDTAANGDTLPVFELRTPSKAMTYAQAHQWALDMFDYIVSLNANPGGGHTRI
jgi:hypothetical protein